MKWLASVPFLATFVNAGVARAWSLGDAIGLGGIQAGHGGIQFGARQLPGNGTINLPPECKAICDPVLSVFSTCTPAQCCTASFEMAFFGCFLCVGGTTTTNNNYTIPQQTLDNFVTTCASLGLTVPKLTLPGQDPNRPLSTLPGGSTAVATPSLPSSTPASNSPTAVSPSPPQMTVTSLSTTVVPNTRPDPTDPAFTPPNSLGWRTTSGGWWVGITVLTLGSLLEGWCLIV